MPIEESSDNLNQSPVAAAETVAAARRAHTASERIALTVATCGVGHIPLAPGTWGSLLGIVVYVVFLYASVAASAYSYAHGFDGEQFLALQTTLKLAFLIGIVWLGIWAATRAEPLLGGKDPGAVIIDEIAGQLVTFLFVPFTLPWWMIPVGFVLFRFFDIWKPYPVRRIEALESGLGVMADDLVAGVYAGTVLSLIMAFYLLV
ncbi:MAG: phosphatidylglycerophosphatase A [Pyrinomonadaceae bacterium MAG19_C2-C3]|nr:phosphatidylglycerophosphatase A [Pyrinomonadaceae bacterium MAG19_C2-C3]